MDVSEMRRCLSFDEVMLVPQYSEVQSRHDVDISVNENIKIPLVSAPMDTVFSIEFAKELLGCGGIVTIHRYMSLEKQIECLTELLSCENSSERVWVSIGAYPGNDAAIFYQIQIKRLFESGCRNFLIDVAHGHHENVKHAISLLRTLYKDQIKIIAGNIATLQGFIHLAKWGADIIRIGVAGGHVCTTKFVTGHSIPTFQSVLECAEERLITSHKVVRDAKIIADGGIKNSGDIVKSIAAGADFVMLGSLFAGHEESPGSVVTVNGQQYKEYRGMASSSSQMEWRGRVSVQEGTSTLLPLKGKVKDTIEELCNGIRSGCSYSGVSSLKELQREKLFIEVNPSHSWYQVGAK